MKTIILTLTGLLFVSIVFNSCKKKPHHPNENYGYYSLKEFRDYIYFKKDYWCLVSSPNHHLLRNPITLHIKHKEINPFGQLDRF